MVTVIVMGKKKPTTFTLYKAFICHYSAYFAATFKGYFQEGHTQEVHIEDVNIESFERFAHWLYSKRIEEVIALGHYVDAWLLGNRLLAPAFQNEVLRALDERHLKVNSYPTTRFYNRAWDNTLDQDPLRRYLVALAGSAAGDFPACWTSIVERDVLCDIIKYTKARENGDGKGG